MTTEGYRRRLYCIEWHANLWLQNGTPLEFCERMRHDCSQALDADFYGVERLPIDDPEIARMQVYFDREFSSTSLGPNGSMGDYFA